MPKKPTKSKKKIIIWTSVITAVVVGIGILLAYKGEDIKDAIDDIMDEL